MAERREVLLTCDVCAGDRSGTETLTFGFEGRDYEVDVCARHGRQFRDQVGAFAAAGRRVGRSRGTSRSTGSASRQRAGEIRAWARQQGIEVSERGRISAEVAAQFDARGK